MALAASPAEPGADEVPPSRWTVPFNLPATLKETKMLSTLVCERAQFLHAYVKFVPKQLSKAPAGKLTKLVQSCQADVKLLPELKLRLWNVAIDEHPLHASIKLEPEVRLRLGKEVRPVQPCQADEKITPEPMLKVGKEVRPVQPCQARVKF